MAIEVTPKTKIAFPFWAIISVVVSVILILGLLASYFYFGYKIKKISQEIQAKEAEFIPLEKAIEKKQTELLPLQKKIPDFADLIKNHKNVSNIFQFLEENCLPNVWFNDFKFSSGENKVIVSGIAESFTVLENQVLILEEEERVQSVSVAGADIGEEGEIKFGLIITLNPLIFK